MNPTLGFVPHRQVGGWQHSPYDLLRILTHKRAAGNFGNGVPGGLVISKDTPWHELLQEAPCKSARDKKNKARARRLYFS